MLLGSSTARLQQSNGNTEGVMTANGAKLPIHDVRYSVALEGTADLNRSRDGRR